MDKRNNSKKSLKLNTAASWCKSSSPFTLNIRSKNSSTVSSPLFNSYDIVDFVFNDKLPQKDTIFVDGGLLGQDNNIGSV
jgi:hypothetical protein